MFSIVLIFYFPFYVIFLGIFYFLFLTHLLDHTRIVNSEKLSNINSIENRLFSVHELMRKFKFAYGPQVSFTFMWMLSMLIVIYWLLIYWNLLDQFYRLYTFKDWNDQYKFPYSQQLPWQNRFIWRAFQIIQHLCIQLWIFIHSAVVLCVLCYRYGSVCDWSFVLTDNGLEIRARSFNVANIHKILISLKNKVVELIIYNGNSRQVRISSLIIDHH